MSAIFPAAADDTPRLRRHARIDLWAGLVAVLLGAGALSGMLDLGVGYVAKALFVYALAALGVWLLLPAHRPHACLGPANRVTLSRVALVALLAAGIGQPSGTGLQATLTVLALGAVVLDGVDGWLARRTGLSSEFGARFDMETDALLTLVLAVLCWRLGNAGAWVLLAGALRYLFVAAGWLLPWLRAPLPASQRRRLVCALQALALVGCLSPWPGPPASGWLAGAGLLLLCWSFFIDTLFLARSAGQGTGEVES